MTASTNKHKKRLIFMFACVCTLAAVLSLRVGWIQIVRAEHYSQLAVEQQTRDVPIAAKRGLIYDRNLNELAISAVTNTVWVRPSDMYSAGDSKEERAAKREKTAQVLAEILETELADMQDLVNQNVSLVRIAKYVEKEKADEIRAAMNDADIQLKGVVISEDVKRHYPQGAFLAHVLGSVRDDNVGLSGIELRYDQYLAGTPGRWIKSTDFGLNGLSGAVEKYFPAEDGLSVVLTIDEMIQHYVEQAIDQVAEETQATKVYCVAMDPKTGEILAMASTPDFDPNNSKVPLDPDEAARVEKLSGSEQMEYWNSQMWRNPLISDTYDPGSTFKLLTTAIALEEGVTHREDRFVCTGSIMVANQKLNCWRSRPHGAQNLVEAVGNSCNPVFVTLAQRVGLDTFFDYIETLGLTSKTGIDYPGEAGNILQKRETAGPVGLSTMSYGHGIAVTPISLIAAISSLGNDGMLMKPHLVKALVDADGNVVQSFEPEEVRQVFSDQTVADMAHIMEMVVAEGGGGTAKVTGYRVGGKTGTAEKVINGVYSSQFVCSSFVGMAPMDDPQIAILLVVDEPKGVHFGSQTAAPGVQMILENVLLYMGIEPVYTEEEQALIDSQMTYVPNVTDMNFQDAVGVLGGQSLTYIVSPAFTGEEDILDFTVSDQYPPAGEKKAVGDVVYLYRD